MRWVVLSAALVAGCPSQRPPPYIPTAAELAAYNKTPEERFNDRWGGKSEDDVLMRYGKPNEILQLSNGGHVDSYHAEQTYSVSSGRGAVFRGSGSHSSRSEVRTVYCDRRFEIDSKSLKVVRAVIVGNDCDFNK